MIAFDNISKSYFSGTTKKIPALQDISLQIDPGTFVIVMGPNGSGKSTLLNIVSGDVVPDHGKIWLSLHDSNKILLNPLAVHKRAQYLARVFQDPFRGTSPRMTVAENLTLASVGNFKGPSGIRHFFRKSLNQRRISIFENELSELNMGLEKKIHLPSGFLSGGERQALTILMAILHLRENQGNVLLLDEHTASLDPKTSRIILDLTKKIVLQHNLTALMVTHNPEEALQCGERLLLMYEGKIVWDIRGEGKENLKASDLREKFDNIRNLSLAES